MKEQQNVAGDSLTARVLEEVASERRRQNEKEGFDEHTARELDRAAKSYAAHYIERSWLLEGMPDGPAAYRREDPPFNWPWSDEKPQDPRRDLVRAAALIVGRIERLDRANPPAPSALGEDSDAVNSTERKP